MVEISDHQTSIYRKQKNTILRLGIQLPEHVILNKMFQNKVCYNNLKEVCVNHPFTLVGYLNNERLLVLPE